MIIPKGNIGANAENIVMTSMKNLSQIKRRHDKMRKKLTFADMKRDKEYKEMLLKAEQWGGNFESRFKMLS